MTHRRNRRMLTAAQQAAAMGKNPCCYIFLEPENWDLDNQEGSG